MSIVRYGGLPRNTTWDSLMIVASHILRFLSSKAFISRLSNYLAFLKTKYWEFMEERTIHCFSLIHIKSTLQDRISMGSSALAMRNPNLPSIRSMVGSEI